MHLAAFAILALYTAGATAWLPGQVTSSQLPKRTHQRHPAHGKVLRSVDGHNLFHRQAEANHSTSADSATLQKGIRGVNLGSLFVFEPWIDGSEWSSIGCNGAKSEFDCGKQLGQDGVNKAFTQHWSTYYTQQDFQQMASYGLNTVRIPVGYWVYEDIVERASEPFPQVRPSLSFPRQATNEDERVA